jgi:exosortase A
MSTPLPLPGAATAGLLDRSRRLWLTAGLAIALGLLALGVIYSAEISAAFGVWLASTAFNHCFLILPIALYLVYERRDAVAATLPQPAPLIGVAALPIAACWFVVERAGIMEARQLLAVGVAQVLLLAVLGPKTWRVFAVPFLYLFFLVPTGEFLVPWLQDFTVGFIALGLQLLRIPHFIGGITIEIPEGSFLVAEACAGLRFLIASLAFGVLYACLIYTSPLRRLLFIALSLVVPVIGNGLRALGIVLLGHALGSARAAEVDHVLYGWIFFGIVTALLILAGLPFRQVRQPVPVGRPPAPAASAAMATIAVIAVTASAALPRLVADGLDRAAWQRAAAAPLELPLAAGCSLAPPSIGGLAQAAAIPAVATLTRRYRCDGDALALHLVVFPPRIAAGPVFAALRSASIMPGWDEIDSTRLAFGSGNAAQNWQVRDLERDGQFISVASALWIDGRPGSGGVAGRIRQALAVLRREPTSPVLAVVATEPSGARGRAHAAIQRLLGDAAGGSNVIAGLARNPASH